MSHDSSSAESVWVFNFFAAVQKQPEPFYLEPGWKLLKEWLPFRSAIVHQPRSRFSATSALKMILLEIKNRIIEETLKLRFELMRSGYVAECWLLFSLRTSDASGTSQKASMLSLLISMVFCSTSQIQTETSRNFAFVHSFSRLIALLSMRFIHSSAPRWNSTKICKNMARMKSVWEFSFFERISHACHDDFSCCKESTAHTWSPRSKDIISVWNMI